MKKTIGATLVLALAALFCLPPGLGAEKETKPAPPDNILILDFNELFGNLNPDDPALWELAGRLKSQGEDGLPALREAAGRKQPVAAKLALGWALLSLKDFAPGVKVLASVIDGDASPEAKVAAAHILGEQGRDAAEIELTRLLLASKDDLVSVALAEALSYAATTEAAAAKATATLVRLANARDAEVRAEAAIALAELDDFRDPVPAMLEGLSAEPTERGRLAAKLLQMKRLSDLMIREKEYTGSLGNPLLNEIKDKIMAYHIDPPAHEEALVDAAAYGMTAALHKTDPFSSYMSAGNWDRFRQHISGSYGGIGAHVAFLKDDRTGDKMFTVIRPIYSGPAYKAGVRSYDQILEVDGQDIKGKTADEIRDMLRGLPESVVACKIRRRAPDKDEEFLVQIIRGKVELPTVYHELLPGGIGYLLLTGFGETSSAEIEKALVEMEKAEMKALVFDLRGDPGGLMIAARDVADKFLKDDKLIVYSEGRNKKVAPRNEMRTTDPATHPDYPIMLLVNKNSASASEIVAGALQDHKRAVLLGERTFGKGSVQQIMPLEASGRRAILKLTVARYFLPSGRSIHRSEENRGGVIPDIDVPFEPSWTAESFEKLRAAGDFYRYSFAQWPQNKDKLMELARFDSEDASLYPGFDAWYDGLRVKTDRDSARRLLRQWLRVLTADERGRDWAADLEEDNQLQRAIIEAGETIPDLDMKSIPEYRQYVVRDKAAGGAEKGGE